MQKIIIILLALLSVSASAQRISDTINKELSFEQKSSANAVIIANINGQVTVTGYDGDKIVVEVARTITAKSDDRLEKGKQELKLGVIDRADTIILYVEDQCNSFGPNFNRNRNKSWNTAGWDYNWNCNNGDCRTVYDYKMDFIVKVPASVNLMVSTINEGNISVEKVKGSVVAYNVNGAIKLSNLEREAIASTINGDVDIEYVKNPQRDCRFYSLNGDINAWFVKGLGAELSFDSFNGEFYTNVAKLEPLPVKVEKAAHGEGIRYKVNGSRYQVGQGGAYLDFETFNGNVYLKEKQ